MQNPFFPGSLVGGSPLSFPSVHQLSLLGIQTGMGNHFQTKGTAEAAASTLG